MCSTGQPCLLCGGTQVRDGHSSLDLLSSTMPESWFANIKMSLLKMELDGRSKSIPLKISSYRRTES